MQNIPFILEAGLNHLGDEKKAKKFLNFFLNSKYKKLTFQINTTDYYKKHAHQLSNDFYKKAIELANKKKKKIGLAVCDNNSFEKYLNLKFHFFKLLSIGIKNKKLISLLKKTKKEIFISLGVANNSTIKNCLRQFGRKSKINLIYTNLSYDPKDLNLKKIDELKKKFKLKVGYGHHYNNEMPIYLCKVLNYDFIFLYVKSKYINNLKKKLPDDFHAIELDNLNSIEKKLVEINELMTNRKLNKRIKIFE